MIDMTLYTCLLITHLIGITGGYDDLSYKKDATQSSTRNGPYDAENAVDRNNKTCMRTNPIGQNSLDKATWWKVDLGGLYSIYSINIQFKIYEGYELRQMGRFAGFSLYVSNTGNIERSTLCYKDGPKLPSLNFTTTCTEHGRYVIFYNERLDGVSYPEDYGSLVYTELCEVIVLGCSNHGVYGAQCEVPCPINCADSICHIQHGTCFACKHGWTGTFCTIECTEGWYGNNCSQPCVGYCRDGYACNHLTGECKGGCDAGWFGFACEKACSKSYGENCRHPCSEHCYNKDCDRFNGNCLTGCTDGFYGEQCGKNIHTLRQELSCSINWIAGFSVSVAFNFILVACTCLFCRGTYAQIVLTLRKSPTCCKNFAPEYYTDTDIKHEKTSPYQELNVYASGAELAYQNTTLR